MSASEPHNEANVAAAKEAKQGLFSQFRSHLSNLKSPFNQGNTPAPAEVSLVETPRTGMTRHANNMYGNLYHHIDEAMAFNSFGAIAPYMGQKRGPFLQGCISLKNRSYRPLLRDSTSPFKSTCLLIKLFYVPGALYTPNTCSELTYLFIIWP
jgi:hypothetical protein